MRMGDSDNTGDSLASQPRCYPVPGQPLLNRHQVGVASRSPEALFAQHEGEPTRGRPAVRGKGMTRKTQTTPYIINNSSPRGAQVRPTPPSVPPTLPSVPLHHHCTQQALPTSSRRSDPTGGSRDTVSARRGLGSQRANLVPLQCSCIVYQRSEDLPSSGPPLGPLRHSVDQSVRAGDQAPRGPILGLCSAAA